MCILGLTNEWHSAAIFNVIFTLISFLVNANEAFVMQSRFYISAQQCIGFDSDLM
jgi:hypothetical protein